MDYIYWNNIMSWYSNSVERKYFIYNDLQSKKI